MRHAEGSAGGLTVARASGIALGYALVPAGDAGYLGLDAQTEAIAVACGERGLELTGVTADAEGDHDRELERPGLEHLLSRIAGGEANFLAVADLGHLALPAAPLGALIEWLSRVRAGLIVADLDFDSSNPEGSVAVRALVAAGDLDRQKLRERTREGLAAARSKGAVAGRPAVADRPELRERIVALRAGGMTLQGIANQLNEEAVPTLRGGSKWRPSSVQAAAGYKRPGRRPAARGLPARRLAAAVPERASTEF